MKKIFFIFIGWLLFASGTYSQIVNGNFESGRSAGWIEASQGGYTLIGTGNFFASTSIEPAVNPRSGEWMGRIGGYSYEINAIGQNVTLPNISPLYLGCYIQTRSSSNSECSGLFVGAKISILINNQEIYYDYLCQYKDLHEWTAAYIDLTLLAGQTVQIVFKAEAANSVWSYLYIDDVFLANNITAVDEQQLESDYKLEQNYPNPFNPATNISFFIPEKASVTLKIFDNLGREISTLISEELSSGNYTREWNAAGYPSGVYYYRLQAGSFTETRKLILIK